MAAEGDIKEVEVAKPEDFDAALEAAVGADRLFAFFKGAIVPDTGEPWWVPGARILSRQDAQTRAWATAIRRCGASIAVVRAQTDDPLPVPSAVVRLRHTAFVPPARCSDTRRLEPAFRAALEGKGATTLLVCPCEEATWTAPDKSHPYRQHALLKCTGAPCLLRFSSDGKTVIGRATEDEISDAEIIKFID